MKKYILVFIILLFVASAVGCAESNSQDTKVASEGTSNSGQEDIQQSAQTTETTSESPENTQQPPQTTTETTLAYDDALWLNVLATDMSPDGTLITDMNNMAYACTNVETVGMNQIGIYAENLYQSTNAALQHSNSYNVSPELQPAKDECNKGLAEINTAAMLVAGAVDAYNKGDEDTCISLMESAKKYTDSGGQRFTTATPLLEAYNKKHGVN